MWSPQPGVWEDPPAPCPQRPHPELPQGPRFGRAPCSEPLLPDSHPAAARHPEVRGSPCAHATAACGALPPLPLLPPLRPLCPHCPLLDSCLPLPVSTARLWGCSEPEGGWRTEAVIEGGTAQERRAVDTGCREVQEELSRHSPRGSVSPALGPVLLASTSPHGRGRPQGECRDSL